MRWLLFVLGVMLMTGSKRPRASKPSSIQEGMVALIRAEAERQGVEPALALATAEVESGFNPAASADLQWAYQKPQRYRELVRDNPRMHGNPAREDLSAWHSYGLFMLLAANHVRPHEHPSILHDARVNAERGIAHIKALMRENQHDPVQMRLAYVGAQKLPEAQQELILKRFAEAYQRWHDREAGGPL